MHKLTFLALLLAAGTAIADVYRWVDDKGVVHYADKAPAPDAKPATLPTVQTFDSHALTAGQPLDAPTTTVNKDGDKAGKASYQPRIGEPAANDTIRDAERKVTVVVANPPGNQGTLFVYYLDGAAKNSPTQSTAYQLTEVDRGEHKVAVAATDANGHELSRSEAVTFFMKPPTSKH